MPYACVSTWYIENTRTLEQIGFFFSWRCTSIPCIFRNALENKQKENEYSPQFIIRELICEFSRQRGAGGEAPVCQKHKRNAHEIHFSLFAQLFLCGSSSSSYSFRQLIHFERITSKWLEVVTSAKCDCILCVYVYERANWMREIIWKYISGLDVHASHIVAEVIETKKRKMKIKMYGETSMCFSWDSCNNMAWPANTMCTRTHTHAARHKCVSFPMCRGANVCLTQVERARCIHEGLSKFRWKLYSNRMLRSALVQIRFRWSKEFESKPMKKWVWCLRKSFVTDLRQQFPQITMHSTVSATTTRCSYSRHWIHKRIKHTMDWECERDRERVK